MVQQTWQAQLYVQLKGSIWNTTSSITILETTIRNTTGVGICTKPIRQMCSQQKHRRKAMHDYMACRWLKNITCNQKCSGNILKKLNNRFGQESPLTTCRGKVLEYLGIKIDYRQKGKVKLSMYEYIEKMLEELLMDMEGLVTIPASSPLFNTDPGCKRLCEEQGQLFDHLVAKLLYLSKHTRQDM